MSAQESVKTYEGKPCKNCGETTRYKLSPHRCVACHKKHRERWQSDNSEAFKEAKRNWKKNNQDKVQQQHKEHREKHRNSETYKQRIRLQTHKRKAAKRSRHEPYTPQDVKHRFAAFGNRCVYCGASNRLTVDHFFPVSKGGLDGIKNIVPACSSCNSSKGASDPLDWMRVRMIERSRIDAIVRLLFHLNGI